jgi:hypothetical protein
MARHSQRSIAVFALLSVFAMLAAGCGTSMQTSSEDLTRPTSTEGIRPEPRRSHDRPHEVITWWAATFGLSAEALGFPGLLGS